LIIGDSRNLWVTQDVYAGGFPYDKDRLLSPGKISDLGGPESTLVTVSAPEIAGMSGGPVLNDKFQVIGVVTGEEKVVQGSVKIPTSINYFTRIQFVEDVLRSKDVGAHFQRDNTEGSPRKPTSDPNAPLVFPAGYYISFITCGVPAEYVNWYMASLRSNFRNIQIKGPYVNEIRTSAIGQRTRVYYQGRENEELADRLAAKLQSLWQVPFELMATEQAARPTASNSGNYTPRNDLVVQLVTSECR
jgi:hypothetical protein